MSEQNGKRMVADTGYEVRHAMHIGEREILVAENMEDPDGHYLSERGMAVRDLHRRANNERENLSSDKRRRTYDRCYAR